MIIYKNGLITLDYSPSTDVLHVELPNAIAFGISELQRSLEIVADNVQSYDIKRLLLDSSQVSVGGIDDNAYKVIVSTFIGNLSRSRLRKLARLNTSIPAHEARVTQVADEAAKFHQTTFEIGIFSSRVKAQEWLVHL